VVPSRGRGCLAGTLSLGYNRTPVTDRHDGRAETMTDTPRAGMDGRARSRIRVADLGRLAASVAGVAVAWWLRPASAHLVGWTGSSADVLLFVPPLADLPRPALAGAILGVAVAVLSVRRGPQRFADLASTLSPLLLLWLWAVPFLPGASGRFPLLLVFAGPLRWGIAAAAIGGVVAGLLSRQARLIAFPLPGRLAVFLVSLAIYATIGLHTTSITGPGGDEPHYLVIAQSLLADGDLRIENQHQERQYESYFANELRPDFLTRGIDRVIYSVHAPGTAVAVLPGYAAAGYRGAVLTMALLAAWVALLVFGVAREVAGERAAIWTWIGLSFSVALAPFGWLIYPESVAVVVTALAAHWWWRDIGGTAASNVWRGAAIATLPWIHTKFAPLLAVVVLLLASRCWRQWPRLLGLMLPVAGSLGLWLYSFYVMYGVPSPMAQYGSARALNVTNENIPRGILGLLFDQEFGALPYSPILVAAVGGLWVCLRRRDLRWRAIGSLAAVAALVASVTRVYMWWGGWSTPARFVVPVLPFIAPLMAIGIAQARSPVARGVVMATVLLGLSILGLSLVHPAELRLFNRRDGVGELVALLQGDAPLWAALPSFIWPPWVDQAVRAALWVVAIGLSSLLASWLARGRETSPMTPVWAVLRPLAVLLVVGALAGSPLIRADARPEVVQNGRERALAAFEGDRLAARHGEDWRPVESDDLWRRLTLSYLPGRLDVGREDRVGVIRGVDLPAGSYDLRIWYLGAPSPAGSLDLVFHRTGRLREDVGGGLANPAVTRLTLPISLPDLWLIADAAFALDRVRRIEIVPRRLVPLSARHSVPLRGVIGLDVEQGIYVVFLDDRVFVEGRACWVRGQRSTAFLIAGPSRASITARITNGPTAQEVAVDVGGRAERWPLGPNETRQVVWTLPSNATLLPVVIESPRGFRPSEVDPSSGDSRHLGVRVEFLGATVPEGGEQVDPGQ
jgi:hypothetical protein